MPDYDFRGLSTRSFEKLIQALAAKLIGPGIVVFGDGPDGGREATFEARVPFPFPSDPWDGYCVLQAKFLQRPLGQPHDGRWAEQSLKQELESYAQHPARRRPDYFIFATNVVLTPTEDTGSKDRLDALLANASSQLGLRDWRLWDFDQLSAFLDGQEDVRHCYGAWITAGDVLHQAIGLRALNGPFEDVVANFLAKELLADQYVNLEQAGHSVEDKVALDQVFVDLPVATEALDTSTERSVGESEHFLTTVLDLASERLARDTSETPSGSATEQVEPPRPSLRNLGRIVLIGGPGQGKTTLGQYLCQLFRAALLQDRPQHLLSAEVRSALDAILTHCNEDKCAPPRSRRFPVRIVLAEFADYLASTDGPTQSLLAYIAYLIHRRTGHLIEIDTLGKWLHSYPWILVLDGLDEVPASGNRDTVLRTVEDFWIDVAQQGSDVLVVATTRPQGYSEDFSPKYYIHLWLRPLTPTEAVAYGTRLIKVRYGLDTDRGRKVLSRVRQAASLDSTARLMKSPLQVTIMATLVDQIGQPPQDRWRLFHEYYRVIYQRERERNIPAAQLLRDHQKDIDTIHNRVALLLQVESEASGSADSRLSSERFRSIVAERLREEEKHSAALEESIIEAAATRLVFLVAPQANQIGFEIRSLQEFMAAEALMDGGDTAVQARLRRIASISSWRNVFLFAAGRCFAITEHLRDTISAVCGELNDNDEPLSKSVRAGSLLALDLLEDGVAERQPRYARLLARCAFEVLKLPPSGIHRRLASVCSAPLSQQLRETLEYHLSDDCVLRQSGAWMTTLAASELSLSWPKALALSKWPLDLDDQRTVVELSGGPLSLEWAAQQVESLLPQIDPRQSWRLLRSGRRGPTAPLPETAASWREIGAWLGDFTQRDTEHIRASFSLGPSGTQITFRLTSIAALSRFQPLLEVTRQNVHAGWLPLLEAIRLSSAPSKDTLADCLEAIGAAQADSMTGWIVDRLPWVLSACLQSVQDIEDLPLLADRARAGAFGDADDWVAAERRWCDPGLLEAEVSQAADASWPFDQEIAAQGFPFIAARWPNVQGGKEALLSLIALFNTPLPGQMKSAVADWIVWELATSTEGAGDMEISTLICLYETASWKVSSWQLIRSIVNRALPGDEVARLMSLLGGANTIVSYSARGPGGSLEDSLCALRMLVALLADRPHDAGLTVVCAHGFTTLAEVWASDQGLRDAIWRLDLDSSRYPSRDGKASATMLRICQDAIRPELDDLLAVDVVANCQRQDEAFYSAIRLLVARLDSRAEQLLIRVHDELDETRINETEAVLSGLGQIMSRKKSGLGRRKIWQELGLPGSLEVLLSDQEDL